MTGAVCCWRAHVADPPAAAHRIRRVKCDEARPACERCLSTGRTCDGYPSVFRAVTVGGAPPAALAPDAPPAAAQLSLSLHRPATLVITADQVEKLAHYFTIKNRAEVSYTTEARATLELPHPSVRHALVSLSILHQGFEACSTAGGGRVWLASTRVGLGAYNAAVASLAAQLGGKPSRGAAHAALACCQLFICIEIILGNFESAMQHFLRGLRVAHQFRVRPGVDADGCVVACGDDGRLPQLDIFVIKLFESGQPGGRGRLPACETAQASGWPMASASEVRAYDAGCVELVAHRERVVGFLDAVAALRDEGQVNGLKARKSQVLGALRRWEDLYAAGLYKLMMATVAPLVRVGIAFVLLSARVLKVVASLAMSVSAADFDALEDDFQMLADVAAFTTREKKQFLRRGSTTS